MKVQMNEQMKLEGTRTSPMEKKGIFTRHLAVRGIVFLLALGLVVSFFSPLQAQKERKGRSNQEAGMTLMQLVQKYEDQGYSRLGPLQVTNPPREGSVGFYRHSTVDYEQIEILTERGKDTVVDKYDKVYLLQKDDHVILIRLKKEERSNV